MPYIELVATLAILQFIIFGMLTGKARVVAGLKAPAVTGDEGFERMYRVQMNTLEQLVGFLPALFIASHYWASEYIAGIGCVYLVGRVFYWLGYVSAPEKRMIGFLLSFFPTVVLILLSLIGVISAIA